MLTSMMFTILYDLHSIKNVSHNITKFMFFYNKHNSNHNRQLSTTYLFGIISPRLTQGQNENCLCKSPDHNMKQG